MMGGVQLIIGPMFAGKTTELIRILKRWKLSERKCVLVKHSSDLRYVEDFDDASSKVISHDGSIFPAISLEEFSPDVDSQFASFDVIGIDEGQFVSFFFFFFVVFIVNTCS
jgi:thymidine kinase